MKIFNRKDVTQKDTKHLLYAGTNDVVDIHFNWFSKQTSQLAGHSSLRAVVASCSTLFGKNQQGGWIPKSSWHQEIKPWWLREQEAECNRMCAAPLKKRVHQSLLQPCQLTTDNTTPGCVISPRLITWIRGEIHQQTGWPWHQPAQDRVSQSGISVSLWWAHLGAQWQWQPASGRVTSLATKARRKCLYLYLYLFYKVMIFTFPISCSKRSA